MSDLPSFEENESADEIGDEQAKELVVNAERFLTLIQTGGAEGLQAVTDEDGPGLISGGFAQLYMEATSHERDAEEASEFIQQLIPAEDEISDFELTAEELENIAQLRSSLATMIVEDAGLLDASHVRESTQRSVDALLNEASQTAMNPLNDEQRVRVLNATYHEQIYNLGVLTFIAEDRNSD